MSINTVLIASSAPYALGLNIPITATGFPSLEQVKSIFQIFTCTTAEGGYAVGDKLRAALAQGTFIIALDAGTPTLKMNGVTNSSFLKHDRTGTFVLTPANWDFACYAEW